MESDLPGIIRIKVAAKNILLGSLVTQHQAVFSQCDVSFRRNIQSFWNKLLLLSVFLVKQYTSLIYVKGKSFCLVNWALPFVVPKDPFHAVKVKLKGLKSNFWPKSNTYESAYTNHWISNFNATDLLYIFIEVHRNPVELWKISKNRRWKRNGPS